MTESFYKQWLSEAAEPFFAYSRERYQILLNRQAGKPRNEWTQDPILRAWRFCNIFREDDATTIWFRENIRDPLQHDKCILLATISFRWFNRINAGEEMQQFLVKNLWDQELWRQALQKRKEKDGVIVTGAYIIKTPPKLSKIDALLQLIWEAKEQEAQLISNINGTSLEAAWEVIRQLNYMGEFTSYEVVTDLRYTDMLRNAKDVLSWANPGPGCAAGLGELLYGNRQVFDRHNMQDRSVMIRLMRELLELSNDERFWPQDWPNWELREVEHTLCEFDKYRRAQKGSRLKRRYA